MHGPPYLQIGLLGAALLLTSGWLPQQPASQVSVEKPPTMALMKFKGRPQGGGLKLWIKGRDLEINTRPGEDLAQIASDAAAVINLQRELKEQNITARAQGNALLIQANEVWVFLCPSDRGLVVPLPPRDLRVERDSDGMVHLSWKAPPGGYDRIHILRGSVPVADGIDGMNTEFADYAPSEKQTYYVFGIKDALPSCAATHNP